MAETGLVWYIARVAKKRNPEIAEFRRFPDFNFARIREIMILNSGERPSNSERPSNYGGINKN